MKCLDAKVFTPAATPASDRKTAKSGKKMDASSDDEDFVLMMLSRYGREDLGEEFHLLVEELERFIPMFDSRCILGC